ncbi:DEAD/DEAH box helicase [Paenibacillus nasutitermitis]|uniref:ATP-dependent RNA helicase DbpA n=1 Tax=Paenibacillus nasutitermitis TaxID=1652958 RepID=A0A917E0X8_9BACL|nr:DEAD/DEAH box helicase [Paenibacillus nasutitermitis]GGD90840.1 ATP-dependent RNA helicase DbpA [Paenibacillus nasutitermitis]
MSEQTFKDYALSEDLQKALDNLGYEIPTEVQQKVLPEALQRKDLVVKSQTGSGKTAAFGIPLCELVDWNENKPQALVLTPTRELAVQVQEDLTHIGRFKRIKVAAVYGKQPFTVQTAELKQRTHIIVGTPGRVLDHIQRGTITLGRISCLVIDEADEMLNMGFIEQVEAIIRALPEKRVTMLFSATLPKDVEGLSLKYMNNPVPIEIQAAGVTTQDIQHALIEVKDAGKWPLLQAVTVVENPDSCIIFCRTKEQVDQLFVKMAGQSYSCDKIHGGLEQEVRFEVMNAFKRGQFRYLIATDVAARGIDIDNITLVINYDLPMEKESYVHRTGRTGRAGRQGKAITFATPHEGKFLTDIERYIGFAIPVVKAPSREQVALREAAFEAKSQARTQLKESRNERLNVDIMKLYFNGGKKKKLRAVDFVGTIARIEGVTVEDIGIIAIQDNVTYVDILNGKGPLVLETMKTTSVKGKLLKVHKALKK